MEMGPPRQGLPPAEKEGRAASSSSRKDTIHKMIRQARDREKYLQNTHQINALCPKYAKSS